LAAPRPGEDVHLYVPSLGARTTLWVNDREVARDLDTSAEGPGLRLDPGLVARGTNRIRLLVVPFADGRNHVPETTQLGTVQVRTPPAPWKRRAFGGLAQVILQAGEQAGPITLTASSDGLSSGLLTVEARQAVPRPAVGPARPRVQD
jgi:beta-galactosidase